LREKLKLPYVLGAVPVFYFFCEEPRSKSQIKFKQLLDIPAIASDGITYGVACLQFLDSSLEV
jgi:hypothetical protein